MILARMNERRWDLWGRPVGPLEIFVFLAALLCMNLFYIVVLENAFSISDHFTALGITDSYYEKSWWRYLLPQPEVYGTWASTSVVLGALVQQYVHPAFVLLFSQSVLVLVAFFVALRISNSFVLAATAALLCVTVPFNFHVYSVHGTTAHGLLISYFLLFVDASIRLLNGHKKPLDLAYFGGSTLLFVLGYETWVDVAVVIVLAGLPAFFILRHAGEYVLSRRVLLYVGFIVVLTMLYTVAKITFGFGSGAGTETDLVLFYGWIPAIWSDYTSKVIAFSFTAVSLMLPPDLVSSSALLRTGPEWIVAQQHEYHPQMQFLTYLNQIFLWRFYAGLVFALLAVLGVFAVFRLWAGRQSWPYWVILICVVMILFGASTHSLVKYRPMHSMPYLGYQVWVNVIGAIALASLFVHWVSERLHMWAPAVVCVFWTYFVWVGFSVRSALGIYVVNMQMGVYPDPTYTLWMLVQKLL